MSELTIERLQNLCAWARGYFGPSAIIAGGAPRDLLHGKPVKDIDIFVRVDGEDLVPSGGYIEDIGFTEVVESPVPLGDSKFVMRCKGFAELIGGEAVFRESPEQYAGLADLCDIKTSEYPVQIIAIDHDPVDDVHRYDFGLSQVFVTPLGLFFTPKYRLDDACRQITYTAEYPTYDQINRSKARLARLQAKYADWSFENIGALVAGKDSE